MTVAEIIKSPRVMSKTILNMSNKQSWRSLNVGSGNEDLQINSQPTTVPSPSTKVEGLARPRSTSSQQLHKSSKKETQLGPRRKYNTRSSSRRQMSDSKASSSQEHAITHAPPTAIPKYVEQASIKPYRLKKAKSCLLIVDLNGTLILRDRKHFGTFVARPGLASFLEYIFHHHSVMIWTSMKKENMKKILPNLLTEDQNNALVAAWARDTLGLNKWEYNSKVQVYKRLHVVWSDEVVNPKLASGYPRWHQANTILIDDSALKAASQPFNLVNLPEFDSNDKSEQQAKVLEKVVEYIKEAACWSDVSAFIKAAPFQGFDGSPDRVPSSAAEDTNAQLKHPQDQPIGLDGALSKLLIADNE